MAELNGTVPSPEDTSPRRTNPVALYIKGTAWRSQFPPTPDGRGWGVILHWGVVRLGRLPESDVVLEDRGVSRRHAVLRWQPGLDGGLWTLEDAGSSGGTILDGLRITAPAVVLPGQIIRLGAAELMIWPLIGAPRAAATAGQIAGPSLPVVAPRQTAATPLPVSVPAALPSPLPGSARSDRPLPVAVVVAPPASRPQVAEHPARSRPRWNAGPLVRRAKAQPLAALLLVLLLAAIIPTALAAWNALGFGQLQISGTISGERFSAADERISLGGIPATIVCNGTAAKASPSGAYVLTIAPATHYACLVSSSAAYQSEQVSIADPARKPLRIDFGPQYAPATCATGSAATTTVCPALRFRPASLGGTVTWTEWGVPATKTEVDCWSFADAVAHDGLPNQMFSATTDANGAYSFDRVPPGKYGCMAGADYRLRTVTVSPGVPSTLALPICSDHCPIVSLSQAKKTLFNKPYLHPAVMHTFTAYLVFWLPSGHHFEPEGSDERYERLMAQYFQDIGGTPYYNILTQYWDYEGPVQNTVTLGDMYVDTTVYPHAGTQDNPLLDGDIQAEVGRAISARNWTIDANSEVFVFTGDGIQECQVTTPQPQCSYNAYRAYHSVLYGATAWNPMGYTPYAYIPDDQGATRGDTPSPTGDARADLVLIAVSHEHFETVSDPLIVPTGWFDPDPSLQGEGEIGDLCAFDFGTLRADGSNVTLNHGHSYTLQKEWSNAANGCAFA